MPKSNFTPEQLTRFTTPHTGSTLGINGPVRIIGHFQCDILVIGDSSPLTVRNITFDILDGDCPVLIGQDVLGRGNKRVTYDYDSKTVTLTYNNEESVELNLAPKFDNVTRFQVLTAHTHTQYPTQTRS